MKLTLFFVPVKTLYKHCNLKYHFIFVSLLTFAVITIQLLNKHGFYQKEKAVKQKTPQPIRWFWSGRDHWQHHKREARKCCGQWGCWWPGFYRWYNENVSSIVNENALNVKTLERCFSERIDREMSNIVDTVEDRIQNAVLTAIDNIVTPKIELTIRSINASSGRDVTSASGNSERKKYEGINASFENASANNRTLGMANMNDETRHDFHDGVSELPVLEAQFDRQLPTHHMPSGASSEVHHSYMDSSKVFEKKQKKSNFRKFPKSIPKVSKRVLKMLYGNFSGFFCPVIHAGLFTFSGLKNKSSVFRNSTQQRFFLHSRHSQYTQSHFRFSGLIIMSSDSPN